jgi:hypothetical protein
LRLCGAGSAIAVALVVMLALPAADGSQPIGSPPTATANPVSTIVSADIGADMKPARESVPGANPPAAGTAGPKLFFGYVEFDHNPDAPGSAYGFGPLPSSASQLATTNASR